MPGSSQLLLPWGQKRRYREPLEAIDPDDFLAEVEGRSVPVSRTEIVPPPVVEPQPYVDCDYAPAEDDGYWTEEDESDRNRRLRDCRWIEDEEDEDWDCD